MTGDHLYPRLSVQIGPICERMLNSGFADILIMGIGGVSASDISESTSLNVEPIRAMIRAPVTSIAGFLLGGRQGYLSA